MKDSAALEGTWLGFEKEGPAGDWIFVFSGNHFECTGGLPEERVKGTFITRKVNDSNQIELVLEEGFAEYIGKTSLGIYKLEGDLLTIAGNEPGVTERPSSFEPSENTRVFIFNRRHTVEEAAAPETPPSPTKADAEKARREIAELDRLLQLVRQALDRHGVGREKRETLDRMMAWIVQQKLLVVSLFALLGEAITAEVRQELEEEAPQLAEQLHATGPWFGFEDIMRLTDREVQTLLREVDQKDLVVALMRASDGLREKVLSNMSNRVRTFITEEMEFQGEMRESEVLEVQARIVLQVLQLVVRGQITVYNADPPE